MNRRLLTLHVTVQEGERALLSRNGSLERVLAPGRHALFDPWQRLTAETFKAVRAEMPIDRYNVIKAERPDLAALLFAVVETGVNELAVVHFD